MDLVLTGEPMTDFRLDWQWQEELHYREGDRRLVLHCGWGVSPPVVFVPSASRWDATMPDWLRGRRDEIVRRIEEHSDHVVASADWASSNVSKYGARPVLGPR